MNRRHAIELPKEGLSGLGQHWKTEIISGFLVCLIALPLCLGISLASGFPPIGGIFTAIIGGLIVGPLCGSRLTIKGPAAGLIAIAAGAVDTLGQGDALRGYQLALAVVVVAGLVQVIFGLLKAGELNDFFPASAVHGMLAAIGILIIARQIPPLFGVRPEAKEPLALLAAIPRTLAGMNPHIALIGLVSLFILILLPKIRNRYVKMIPAPVVVILVAISLGHLFDLEHEHPYRFLNYHYTLTPQFLVTLPASLGSSLTFPDFSRIFSYASLKYVLMFGLVGSIESLLTVKAIDGLDPFRRKSNANRDLLAVGLGNTLAGMVGGLPMIAEVVRSSANVGNGAKTRWANFFHGGFLLLFVALAPGLIHQIPLSALAAMLVFTGYRLASPRTFSETYKIGAEQLIIFLVTIVLTLATDLLLGMAGGIVVKVVVELFYGTPFKSLFKARVKVVEKGEVIQLIIYQAAVFTNYLGIKKYLSKLPPGKRVIIDLSKCKIVDHTVMEHLHFFERDYPLQGGEIELRGLDKHLPRSGHPLASRKISQRDWKTVPKL